MKALLCKHYGPPESLVVEDLPDLVPGERRVVIDVRAPARLVALLAAEPALPPLQEQLPDGSAV